MNLKQRFSFIFSLLFSLLLGAVLVAVFFLFANFRRMEFRSRLVQRAETTVKFLVGVKGIDIRLLELFDKNRVNKLYNEKTTVYDEELQRLYTSNNNYMFNWNKEDFEEINRGEIVYKAKEEFDVIGMKFKYGDKIYYVLTSAEDRLDNPYLAYLKYLLFAAFLFGTTSVWTLSYYLSKASLKPLDKVRNEIQEITDKNLKKRISLSNADDEINELSRSFNQMMDRIDNAYQRQKEFTGNASHELRTPIARVTAQLENMLHQRTLDNGLKKGLKAVSKDIYQLSDIVTSLLVLSEIDNSDKLLEKIRLDEIIFDQAAQLSAMDADFRFQFEIEGDIGNDENLNVDGDEILLKLVFRNLFKNAYMYSDNKSVNCILTLNPDNIQIIISNTGKTPQLTDTSALFNTFVRGSNVTDKTGSGVGLSIVKRILQYHNGTIEYLIPAENVNQLKICFTKKSS